MQEKESRFDHLFAPWRIEYITADKANQLSSCPFCLSFDGHDDKERHIIKRCEYSFIILNAYPYNNGHIMVIPYKHVNDFELLPLPVLTEMMKNTILAERALKKVYNPAGFNLGMNIGSAGGAGISDHLHLHILPRWSGDTNFMTSVGGVRVCPEDLSVSTDKLRQAISELEEEDD